MGAGDDGGAMQIKKTPKCWGRGRKKGDIGVGAFCPGWSHDPGQNALLSRVVAPPGTKGVFLGGPGKFPARGPPLVPGGSTTRDQRGPFSPIPAKSYVCFCFFLLLF